MGHLPRRFGLLLVASTLGCGDDGRGAGGADASECAADEICPEPCENETCSCAAGDSCLIECAAPPCHIECKAGSSCSGVCANGTCTCEMGATECLFSCQAPPCHVECQGGHDLCVGVCANGGCNCGPNSDCEFLCDDGNCSAVCGEGSRCTLRCPNGNAGEQGCTFSECAAGEPTICADGAATTCDAPCP